MTLEVLISAMNQQDFGLFESIGVVDEALMINQCGCDGYCIDETSRRRIISSSEKGLSRSRNMAIKESVGDICLFVDDDEELVPDYDSIIRNAFINNPKADIICFKIAGVKKKYSNEKNRIGYLRALKVGSCQIAIKRESIINNNIKFDENFGSGTEMGSGEENIFLYDCLKKRLRIYYEPILIGSVKQNSSHWFFGFTEEYFYKRGRIIKRLLGKYLGFIYAIYFIISKRQRYKDTVTTGKAFAAIMKGLYH